MKISQVMLHGSPIDLLIWVNRCLSVSCECFCTCLRRSKDKEELDEYTNDRQNGDLRSSIFVEGSRSDIAGWRVSSVTDEELIEGLSFPAYRRVSTMILVPAQSHQAVEMVTIDPLDLQVAQDRDAVAHQSVGPRRSEMHG
jgi:hypothetical protein